MNKFSIIKVIPYLLLVGYSFIRNLALNNGAVFREYVYLISKVERDYFSIIGRGVYLLILMIVTLFLIRVYLKKKDYTYLMGIPLMIYLAVHLVSFKTYNEELDYVLKGVYLIACVVIDFVMTAIYILILKLKQRKTSFNS